MTQQNLATKAMIRSTSSLVFLSVVTLSVTAFGQKQLTPTSVVKNFYNKYVALRIAGLPNDKEMRAIAPFLSSEIKNLIARDRKQRTAYMKRYPGNKPPWTDGDLFSSLFEGATSFKIRGSRKKHGAFHIDVNLIYRDGRDESPWTDTVILKPSKGGRWVIVNILFDGKWQFKVGSSLLNVLK